MCIYIYIYMHTHMRLCIILGHTILCSQIGRKRGGGRQDSNDRRKTKKTKLKFKKKTRTIRDRTKK